MTESIKNPRIRSQRIADRIVCVARSVWYSAADRIRLCLARRNWAEKKNPLISIIIPTRDRWDLLGERAIPSILNQTYENWELIIIDDGTWTFSNGVYGIDNRVKLWHISKDFHYPRNAWCRWCAGPVRALNFALSKVKGDYILRMDDDDELLPNALEDLLTFVRGTDREFVSAQHILNGVYLGRIVKPYIIRGKKIGGIQTTLMRSYLKCFRYNPDCWRKKWNSPNDLDLVDRMIKAGVRVAYLPKVVCQIRPRPNQTEIGWKAQQKEYQDAI